ncbi:MAG: response regulator [Planctomycetales bacterium]|nr:response regulator [Planctomycetales bacterium]
MPATEADRRVRRVLIVDDNRAIHDDFHRMLQNDGGDQSFDAVEALFLGEHSPAMTDGAGYEIADAYQGEEGVDAAAAAIDNGEPFDVAFVDMRMPPGLDGVETVERLWAVDPGLQVVLCTAYTDYSWREIVDRLGHNDQLLILKKPFDHVEVAQAADALARKRRLIDDVRRRQAELEQAVACHTTQLRRSWEETEKFLGAISSLLIGVDSHGVVNRWNDAAVEAFGILPEQAVGQRLQELPIRWAEPRTLQRLLSGCCCHTRVELQFEGRDETIRVLGLTVCPIVGGEGAVLLARDITEQRLMEQQLAESGKMEAIGQLAAGVAHEINTPMQYLGDNLEYLADTFARLEPLLEQYDALLDAGGDSAAASRLRERLSVVQVAKMRKTIPESLEDARDGVDRVSHIVHGLKEFSHPGWEQRVETDVNRSLETTATITRNEWKYVAQLCWDLDRDLPRPLAYASELNQVLVNLMVNAAHAVSDATNRGEHGKGTITLRTRHDGDFVAIEIEDDGVGIPPELRDRVFAPFFTTKEVGRGTGQGLASAKRLIEDLHGGEIRLESRVGRGTKCTVRLPLKSELPGATMKSVQACGESAAATDYSTEDATTATTGG